ncbi:hypothetical protein, no similarity [Geotrichum candidum]|uniref:Uncharacterized protein n=1 Tax=Geotrichum candidum TaxID=1173061 RepID=A0A0J9X4H5_GEOCN|nr:hypothetical protein, no similarity [Geotrichum candidum]
MSQSSSAIAHSPVNNFNPSQAEEFLAKAYEQSLREAQKPGASQQGVKVYKPTSGGWTTAAPANAGASMAKILNDLARARPGNANNKKK